MGKAGQRERDGRCCQTSSRKASTALEQVSILVIVVRNIFAHVNLYSTTVLILPTLLQMASLNPLAPSFFPSKSNLTRPTSIYPTHNAEPLPALLADVTSSHPPYTPITHSFHLRIGQLNCQSATHKIPVIESLLHTSSLDLLFLCETWSPITAGCSHLNSRIQPPA